MKNYKLYIKRYSIKPGMLQGILFLLLFPFSLLQAQEDIVLSQSVSGNTEVVASRSITLAPGFTTLPGSVFKASIGTVPTSGGTTTIGTQAATTPAAGSSGQNYIKTIIYQEAQTSIPSSSTAFRHSEVIQYFNGLGRLSQTVQVGASPSGNDIIVPTLYDVYGREDKKLLPYTNTRSGEFRTGVTEATVNTYYNTASTVPVGITMDSKAYTQIGFENSPLNRVLSQTGPGADWNNKPVGTAYKTNAESKSGWKYSGATLSTVTYPANSLYVVETTDEEGNITAEYKDKQGLVVYKESRLGTNTLRTAYVYDEYGLLRCVVPPLATDPSQTDLCYYYKYDNRNRMEEKQIPGAGTVKMVYDQRDRLRCTQNAVQAATNDWSFTKYDELNRPVVTGVLKSYIGDIKTAVTSETLSETYNGTSAGKGYTDASFPGSGQTKEIHSASYYDNYAFIEDLALEDSLNYSTFTDVYISATQKDDTPVGRVTGTMTWVLAGETNSGIVKELYSASYYDKYGHLLRSISYNHLGGNDVITNKYEDITYRVTQSRQEHYKGPENIVIDKTMEYDHEGRLLATKQKTGSTEITLNANKYNEVGQQVEKYLHSPQTTGSRSFLQKVDYQYNIRGWLTKINDPSLSTGNDLFGMALNYNTSEGLGSLVPPKTLYNGNISGIRWKIKNDGEQKAYVFSYDNLNRLLTSKYAEGATLTDRTDYFNENITEYDNNGNIKKLTRYFNNTLVDNLTYTYAKNSVNTNQIKSIADPQGNGTGVDDYPGNSSTYAYDANGNMTTDGSRGTTMVYFPTLNLINYVSFGDVQRIHYYYSTTGTKLAKHVIDGSSKKITHYIGNIVYEDGKLSYILTEEGRLIPQGTGTSRTFVNEYNLKDHLGNNRVTFMPGSTAGSLNIVQTANYYPFGLVMNQTNQYSDPLYAKNKYLYNGKEYQDETLNNKFFGMYDYGARFYDPQVGRWHSMDNLAEKNRRWSPYTYAIDNPIRFIDPDGNDWWDFLKGMATGAGNAVVSNAKGLAKLAYGATPGGTAQKAAGLSIAVGAAGGMKPYAKQVANNIKESAKTIINEVKNDKTGAKAGELTGAVVTNVAIAVAGTKGLNAISKAGEVTNAAQVVSLEARAAEIHEAVSTATQTRTTIAVANATTSEGVAIRIVGSSEKYLRPAQRAMLGPGEVAAAGIGHAEATVLRYAASNGMTVSEIAASRPICPSCATMITDYGAAAASALK